MRMRHTRDRSDGSRDAIAGSHERIARLEAQLRDVQFLKGSRASQIRQRLKEARAILAAQLEASQ